MADYEFKYSPLTGRLTGKQMIEQTEQAINRLASLMDDAAGQVEIISTLANEANENAATALETAEEALATTGRTYITVSIPANANDYYDSQLIYIADNTSTNIPVADTGMLETKTNDNKTACEQVFIADSSGASYYRHGDITAETVGDVTTYTVTWGGWSSEPASQAYVQGELANYLPLSGGTLMGALYFNPSTSDGTGGVIWKTASGIRLASEAFGTASAGAYIDLNGRNYSGNPGTFSICANSASGSKILIGKPDGTLTWDGIAISLNGHTHSYLPLSGGTLTGALNTANNTWNELGDDAAFGDHNVGGKMCVKTQTSTATGIAFFNSSNTNVGQVEVNNAFDFNKTVKVSGKTAEVVNTIGSNYIRYESGLQICWFNENVSDTDKTITFPSAFASAPRVTASVGARISLRVVSVTATNFIAQTSNSSNTNCQFIAVGKWK